MSSKNKNDLSCLEKITHAITAFSFIFGVWQFWLYRGDLMVQRSLELNNRLFDSTIVEAREKIDLNYKDAEFLEAIKKSAKKDKIEQIYESRLLLKAYENSSKFSLLYDFYWNVAHCVEKDKCELESINNSVISSGRAFFINNHKYYCESFLKFNEVSPIEHKKIMKFYVGVDEICE